MSDVKFSRVWAMPSADTLSIPPIRDFASRYLGESTGSVDMFARDSRVAKWRNDINPGTKAEFHMDAGDFCLMLAARGVRADVAIFDPPYSVRQISECYSGFGRKATTQDTQASFYTKIRDALMSCLDDSAVVLSFGWNSGGMGIKRGFEQLEIMLVAHGGPHNDTICVAERRMPKLASVEQPDNQTELAFQ